jgi:3-methyladenine DNA glycosylase AlkD
MNARAEANELVAALRAKTDPARATQEKRYLKSDLEHFGVSAPVLRSIGKSFFRDHADASRKDVLGIVRSLWSHHIHEARALAVEMLIFYGRILESADLELVERLIRESKTWALVDTLAVNVAGDLVERFPDLAVTLDRWAADEDFWVRRSAMLALLKPLRRGDGDFDRFAGYADATLDEREFFIRKAIGWILREVSKKRPELVYDWLLPRATRASGVTVREAVKYLSADQRTAIEGARRR